MRIEFMRSAAALAAVSLAGCASAPAAPDHPDFTGIWSGSITTTDNAYWGVEDYVCFPGCPKVFYDHLRAAAADPANADAPMNVLIPASFGVMAEDRAARSTPAGLALLDETMSTEDVDLASYCKPYGFVREALNALPMAIREEGGDLVFQYEEFNLSRTIHMDERALPADLPLAPLGHSVGRYEDGALVVETAAIAGDVFVGLLSPTVHWGGFADDATAVERYVVKDNPRRLIVELTITDPVTLKEPYVWTKTWLSTPDVALLEDSCEDVPGQPEEQGGAS